MPNPLMKLGNGANRGTQPPDRPQPLPPVPERYVGDNNPYRGTEDHGIPGHDNTDDDISYDNTRDAYFELEPAAPDVVPVRIVQSDDGKRSIRKLRTHVMQITVGDPPRLILGRNELRTKATIKSTSGGAGDILYIGGDQQQASIQQGFPLMVGNAVVEHITESQESVYASLPVVVGGSVAGVIVNVWVAEIVTVDL